MSDKFVSDTTAAFKLGQTVIAKVTNLDEEKRRFLVSLKISDVITPDGDARTRLLNGLQERRAAKEMLAVRGALVVPYAVSRIERTCLWWLQCLIVLALTDDGDLRQQLVNLRVGQKLKLTVDSVSQDGAKLKSDDLPGAAIVANKHHVAGMFRIRNL